MKLKRFLAVLLIVFSFSLLWLPNVYADEDTTDNAALSTQWQDPNPTEPTDNTLPSETVPEETQPEEETQPTYQGDIYEPPATQEETQPPTFYPIEDAKPTNPRVTGNEDNSGNLIIAVALWVSIILGVIIVVSISVVTHRRKTM